MPVIGNSVNISFPIKLFNSSQHPYIPSHQYIQPAYKSRWAYTFDTTCPTPLDLISTHVRPLSARVVPKQIRLRKFCSTQPPYWQDLPNTSMLYRTWIFFFFEGGGGGVVCPLTRRAIPPTRQEKVEELKRKYAWSKQNQNRIWK